MRRTVDVLIGVDAEVAKEELEARFSVSISIAKVGRSALLEWTGEARTTFEEGVSKEEEGTTGEVEEVTTTTDGVATVGACTGYCLSCKATVITLLHILFRDARNKLLLSPESSQHCTL
eukprot:TRINITY_DN87510_c0_g1_i1.p1 TRINITY_DN87510_c0_g1~~TRINITY_DN87510_c0_g1_i1.p1  ORF type:complete len:119 (+),score=2.48 TRINITY_DN87510_c0_g1_i1:178-534(+)